MVGSMLGVTGMLGAGCSSGTTGSPPASVSLQPDNLTIAVGERAYLQVRSNVDWRLDANCQGIAQIEEPSGGYIWVTGLTPNQCQITAAAKFVNVSSTTNLTVVDRLPDAGAPDAADVPDAGDTPDAADSSPPVLCSVPVAKVADQGARGLYMAYTDLDSGPANSTCPVYTSTDFRGDVVFSFLSGTPGYSIDGRGNYIILSAEPATLHNEDFSSSADAMEGDIVTVTFQRRVFDHEDASATPPTWTMTFRMVADPDPAQWKVELFSFAQVP